MVHSAMRIVHAMLVQGSPCVALPRREALSTLPVGPSYLLAARGCDSSLPPLIPL